MPLKNSLRRGLGIAIPLFTALFLFGGITAIFAIQPNENLWNTGITLTHIFAILNLVVLYLIYRHQVP